MRAVRLHRSAVLAYTAAVSVAVVAQAALAADPAPARASELAALVRDDCGACHGMRLGGGLGPALTPEALERKPVDGLVATVLAGRRGTAMPPWRGFVSEAEAEWLVARLLAGDIHAAR